MGLPRVCHEKLSNLFVNWNPCECLCGQGQARSCHMSSPSFIHRGFLSLSTLFLLHWPEGIFGASLHRSLTAPFFGWFLLFLYYFHWWKHKKILLETKAALRTLPIASQNLGWRDNSVCVFLWDFVFVWMWMPIWKDCMPQHNNFMK